MPNICNFACYRLKQGLSYSKRVMTFEQLTNKYSIQQIKEFIKTKAICINYCGKCDYCLSIKRQRYKKRVQSQLKQSNYNYLITLTFDNNNIKTLITNDQKQKVLNAGVSISHLSNLSKVAISNIIRSWKIKLNDHYQKKVDFHYFLCGEYGENTKRAHYHILLMLSDPIPFMIRQNVRGNHYKSKLLESTQYSMYDLEPANNSLNTAGYISKYLSKSDWVYSNSNFNRFHEEQLKYYYQNNIDPTGFYLLNKKDDLKYLFLFYLIDPRYLYYYSKNFSWSKIKVKICDKQKPFVKCSRGLGMRHDPMDNLKQGVINAYYLNKYKMEYDVRPTKELGEVLKMYDDKRRDNVQKYFYNSVKNVNKKYKNSDIL